MSLPGDSLTTFLNVDLDLRVDRNLDELLRHLEPSVVVLSRSEQFASVELNVPYPSLDDTVLRLVDLIQSLPPLAKDIWNQCELRNFNIGIQAGNEPHQALFVLSSTTLSQLANIQGDVTVTVYAPVR